MRTLNRCRLWVSLLLVFSATATAKADFQITATLNSTHTLDPSADVKINLGGGDAPFLNYKPGEVNWTGKSSNPGLFNGPFITFCIQLNQDINPGSTYTYTVTDLQNAPTPGKAMGTTKADEIKQLWGGFYSSIGSDGTKAAAFQLAIWKIESDWGDPYALDFSSHPTIGPLNNFQASGNSDATNQAVIWLTDLQNNTYTRADLVALTSDRYQDQVAAVPVPPSVTLAGIGILCLIGYGCVCRRATWRQRPAT